jgi:hypothetical protein
MMGDYFLGPRGIATTWEPVVVALVANTTKTVLQIATPSTVDIRICAWGVSFDGVLGTAAPVICQLFDGDVAASALTSATPDTWDPGYQPSFCVGGAALTGHGGGVTPTEGVITSIHQFDTQHVHPQSGYSIWYPDTRRPRVAPSRFLRIRCRAQAAVNVLPWLQWNE